jgi:hypothetical protein
LPQIDADERRNKEKLTTDEHGSTAQMAPPDMELLFGCTYSV